MNSRPPRPPGRTNGQRAAAPRPQARRPAAAPVAPPPPAPEPFEPPAPAAPPPQPTSQRTVARRAARQTGQRAELMATWLLRLTGFRILARNYRTPVGEIDLVARRGRLLIFVEVKARADQDTAALSITQRQKDRIYRAAEVFLVARPELGDCAVRFDAIIVAPGRFPRHIKDTWRERGES